MKLYLHYLHMYCKKCKIHFIMTNKNKLIVERIREIRLNKNISQSAIAKDLSITVTAYNRIENNKTKLTVNNLFRIAEALDVDIDILLQLAVPTYEHNNNNIVMTHYNHGILSLAIHIDQLDKMMK